MKRAIVLTLLAALLAACGNNPPVPDWQMNARSGLDSFTNAYLGGNTRVEAVEFARAREALASTGRPELVARAELLRCAARVASLANLAPEPCSGFEALRADAAPPERAYADYLAGKLQAADAPLLPEAHRSVAASAGNVDSVEGLSDPLSRLVAAGVLLQAGRASLGRMPCLWPAAGRPRQPGRAAAGHRHGIRPRLAQAAAGLAGRAGPARRERRRGRRSRAHTPAHGPGGAQRLVNARAAGHRRQIGSQPANMLRRTLLKR
jgi:hypothetical protein